MILAFAGCLAIPLLYECQRVWTRERRISDIERMGGVYLRDLTHRDRPVISLDLSATFADDTGRVSRKSWVQDADLARLRQLTRLESLTLRQNPISDAGLIELASLPRLRRIDLTGTRVTEAGIRWLRRARPNLMIVTDE